MLHRSTPLVVGVLLATLVGLVPVGAGADRAERDVTTAVKDWLRGAPNHGTPGCRPAAVVPFLSRPPRPLIFEGLFGRGFEVSSFVQGTDECPGYWQGFWLVPDQETSWLFDEVYPERAGVVGTLQIVRARFWGMLSPPGRYGHLGGYEHEVKVLRLLDIEPWVGCGSAPAPPVTALPDLIPSSVRWIHPRYNGRCAHPDQEPTLRLCVANRGRVAAGPFRIATDGERVEWRVTGLGPGESRCFAPREVVWAHNIYVDADDGVAESIEYNNHGFIPMERATAPPPCPSTATPTPALPDLAVTWGGFTMENYDFGCVPELGRIVYTFSIGNPGGAPAGEFVVRSLPQFGDWSVDGLAPDASIIGEDVLYGPHVRADADDQVVEADESNNEYFTGIPTPPPTCPPGRYYLAPTVPVTPTRGGSSTPATSTQTPTLMPTATPTISATAKPGATSSATTAPLVAIYLPKVVR